MSLSAHTLRSSPYSIPPPSGNTCRLGSRPSTGAAPYGAQTFSTQLQHHYFNPAHSSLNQTPGGAAAAAAAAAGFSFQNSMLLPGSSQAGGAGGGQISPQTTPSSSISAASSMPLPDSPSQDASDSMLSQSSVQRRQSVSSHGSPIPPSSPILEEEHAGEYKICSYRSPAIGQTSLPANTPNIGMNSAFFPGAGHGPTASASSLQMQYAATGMGYHNSPSVAAATATATMCPPTSMYAAQDSVYGNGASSFMWNYPSLPSFQGNPMTKLSLDTPRYKLTPERAIPLIKWFEEHKEHPYPTRHEKMLLCQSTQLTYTQVSTWFANARRRMKKANSEEEECRSNQSSSDECASQNSLDSPLRPS